MHGPGMADQGFGLGLGGRDQLVGGSGFALNRVTKTGGILSFWSRSASSSFYGQDGALALNGDVRSTMFGADYAKGRIDHRRLPRAHARPRRPRRLRRRRRHRTHDVGRHRAVPVGRLQAQRAGDGVDGDGRWAAGGMKRSSVRPATASTRRLATVRPSVLGSSGRPGWVVQTSEFGRDYRVGYGLEVLEQGDVELQLGVDAERRVSPVLGLRPGGGGADQRVVSSASLSW